MKEIVIFIPRYIHVRTYYVYCRGQKINDKSLESSPNQVGRTATGVRERIVCVRRSIGQDETVT